MDCYAYKYGAEENVVICKKTKEKDTIEFYWRQKMFNYKNLCDYEFEILCKDIMQKKLGVPLQIFARGRDGGIDITDDTVSKNVVIQVKHYINSKYSDLISSLKK